MLSRSSNINPKWPVICVCNIIRRSVNGNIWWLFRAKRLFSNSFGGSVDGSERPIVVLPPESRVPVEESRVLMQESQILMQESRVLMQESRVLMQESRPRAGITCPHARITYPHAGITSSCRNHVSSCRNHVFLSNVLVFSFTQLNLLQCWFSVFVFYL